MVKSQLPSKIIIGSCLNIDDGGKRLTDKVTPILSAVIMKVRSLGTANYLEFGDGETMEFRLNNIDDSIDIDWIDDLSKVVVKTDSGSGAEVEYIGG